jgi:hypothetical protein
MSISDIRKSKTQQKKLANDGLKKSHTIIEVHEKSLAEIQEIDFSTLKKQVEEKTAELEKLSNFDWNNYYSKQTRLASAKKDYSGLVAKYKETELKLKVESETNYADSKGCSTCGSKIDPKQWELLKSQRIEKFQNELKSLKTEILAKRESNKILVTEFEELEKSKPDETTALIISDLKKELSSFNVQIAKGNDIFTLQEKIAKEQKNLDSFAAEIMSIEGFMDRFATFLVDNYYKSINENFEGLFFDVENECKCTNVHGTEFKDFSLSEKINAGVQIVSVLSKKIGLQFPIWIDNRESVTELYPIDTQIINLKVLEND